MLVSIQNNYCYDQIESIWDMNVFLNPLEGKENVVTNVLFDLYYDYGITMYIDDEKEQIAELSRIYNELKQYYSNEMTEDKLETCVSSENNDVSENEDFREETISHIYQIIEQLDEENKNKIPKSVRVFLKINILIISHLIFQDL